VCIYIHVYVRSGFLLPQNFTSRIPAVISNCTNPFHHRFLVEACLLLSVMDKGATLQKLILDGMIYLCSLEVRTNGAKWIDETRMIILDLNLELIFSHMIQHPQKRVQKAALSAISGLCTHGKPSTCLFSLTGINLSLEISCAALIEQHVIDLLLYEIWGSDPQWQSEALAIFSAFIGPGKKAAMNLEGKSLLFI